MLCYTLIFAFATIIRVTEKNTVKVQQLPELHMYKHLLLQ